MQLSAIVPLFNCLPFTQAMVASLQATLPAGLSHEIILVDDGSTDGTRDWLATLRDPPFRVVLNERNLGYAGANNRGAAFARGEFLALLNNDLVLTPRWLEPILAVHAQLGARAGLVGNIQRDSRTGALDHTGIFINCKGKPEHDTELPRWRRWPRRGWKSVAAVTGACVVLRRALWQQLGGFDEGYCNGGEDVDLCFRAEAAGHVNVVALRSAVGHHVSASPGRKLRDEQNSYRLTQRWRAVLAEQAVRHAARKWCRRHLATYWSDPRDFPDRILAWQAFLYAWYLRPTLPARTRARLLAVMQTAIETELARWETMFGP